MLSGGGEVGIEKTPFIVILVPFQEEMDSGLLKGGEIC